MRNFAVICASAKVTAEEKVSLIHEFLEEESRKLYDGTFEGTLPTRSKVEAWMLETYPTNTDRGYSHDLIRNFRWTADLTAPQFIAKFNHCFVGIPKCDNDTKVQYLMDKLPEAMQMQARLQYDHVRRYGDFTQWVVNNAALRHVTPRPAVVDAVMATPTRDHVYP